MKPSRNGVDDDGGGDRFFTRAWNRGASMEFESELQLLEEIRVRGGKGDPEDLGPRGTAMATSLAFLPSNSRMKRIGPRVDFSAH